MEPVLEAAGKKLSKVPNFVIAKMDATANEVDGISIGSYPTFKWYPAYKKHNAIEVTGLTDEKSVVDYVLKHLTKKFSGEL